MNNRNRNPGAKPAEDCSASVSYNGQLSLMSTQSFFCTKPAKACTKYSALYNLKL